jgi:hypothetical protein
MSSKRTNGGSSRIGAPGVTTARSGCAVVRVAGRAEHPARNAPSSATAAAHCRPTKPIPTPATY